MEQEVYSQVICDVMVGDIQTDILSNIRMLEYDLGFLNKYYENERQSEKELIQYQIDKLKRLYDKMLDLSSYLDLIE